MFSKENFIMLSVNTIISTIVIFILFKLQDNKIRYYFKRLDKKLNYNNTQNIDLYDNLQKPSNLSNDLNVSKLPNDHVNNNDIDSYIDPLEND